MQRTKGTTLVGTLEPCNCRAEHSIRERLAAMGLGGGGIVGLALLDDPVPVVSITFGCPSPEIVRALHDAGSAAVVTVTCPEEAAVAVASGADGLCAELEGAAEHLAGSEGDGRVDQSGEVAAG